MSAEIEAGELKKLKADNARLKRALDKAEKEKQAIFPGMEGYKVSPMQRHFGIIRGSTPEAKRDNDEGKTHTWCAKQAGFTGNHNTLKTLASRMMKNPNILKIVQEQRALQEKRVQDSGDDVLRDLLDLSEMSLGRKPVPFSSIDEDGKVMVDYRIDFNPAVAKSVIELRGKHKEHKLWTDKTELTGADGAPLDVAREVVYVNASNIDEVVSDIAAE